MKTIGAAKFMSHTPSQEQCLALLDQLDYDGLVVIDRYPGRGGGTGHIDAVLSDEATMEQIMEGLRRDRSEGATTGETIIVHISWVPSLRFGGITYEENWHTLTLQDLLGPELHRVAFMVDDHAGSNYILQDGDATLLPPGTPVHEVKGYKPEFRLAALVNGRVKIFEADTNPLAETGEDLIDIRGKVTSIDILSRKHGACNHRRRTRCRELRRCSTRIAGPPGTPGG